jgi:hypothetical protein
MARAGAAPGDEVVCDTAPAALAEEEPASAGDPEGVPQADGGIEADVGSDVGSIDVMLALVLPGVGALTR